jgi:hypothetical protein
VGATFELTGELDQILYVGDGIEHCLHYAYVRNVGMLVLPRIYCYSHAKASYSKVTTGQKARGKSVSFFNK